MDPLAGMPKPVVEVTSRAMRFMGSTAFGVVFLVLASIVFALVNQVTVRAEAEADKYVTGSTAQLAVKVFLQLLVVVVVAVAMAHFVPDLLRRLGRMVGMNLLVSSEAEMTMFLVLAIVFNSGTLQTDIADLGARLSDAMGM